MLSPKAEINKVKPLNKSNSPFRPYAKSHSNSSESETESYSPKNTNFNPKRYVMKSGELNYQQQKFKEQFYDHLKVNRKKINQ